MVNLIHQMVGAATFHAAMVEITIGSLTLSVICTIMCLQYSFKSPIDRFNISENKLLTMDRAALIGAILGTIMMPFSIMTGTLSVAGDPTGSILLYNKFVYSGLALGFWVSYVIGRVRLGPNLWKNKKLNILQVSTAILAFFMTITIASIGGKLVRNESLLDLIPFWFPINSTIVIHPLLSIVIILIGICSIITVSKFGEIIEYED
ncbi:MAG: hypothetical protein HOJ64_03720 [Euryarchaeota archaeon]|jgi:hypothetical protein|nr:hypothetical protein [Euryarchaeota archaeon]MBT4391368.1 hypothetical protein [Euryarchaeota archaeon]MBT4802062.1 hypothetical protein [Euryarchaeota archaeon]MBT5613960.1 hypothetical protein [Euryarchaeota archaeon]MBT6684318.1 hypothetical protein [Euryarchaeota archaeon]